MLSAVTRRNRHEVMTEVNDAVVAAGGWVEGHTLFSNIATTFRTVLPEPAVSAFAAAVVQLGVHLDAESIDAIAAIGSAPRQATERSVTLNVTFVHDEPDLRREVPMVPG
jgi:hypothetical protein